MKLILDSDKVFAKRMMDEAPDKDYSIEIRDNNEKMIREGSTYVRIKRNRNYGYPVKLNTPFHDDADMPELR